MNDRCDVREIAKKLHDLEVLVNRLQERLDLRMKTHDELHEHDSERRKALDEQLNDVRHRFVDREFYLAQYSALENKVSDLERWRASSSGERTATVDHRALFFAVAAMLMSLIASAATILSMVGK